MKPYNAGETVRAYVTWYLPFSTPSQSFIGANVDATESGRGYTRDASLKEQSQALGSGKRRNQMIPDTGKVCGRNAWPGSVGRFFKAENRNRAGMLLFCLAESCNRAGMSLFCLEVGPLLETL